MASPAPVRDGFEAERFSERLPTSHWVISDERTETIPTFNSGPDHFSPFLVPSGGTRKESFKAKGSA